MDKLECPVCGREMVKTERKAIKLSTTSIPASDLYRCEEGHESVSVVTSHVEYPTIFVYLGEGCYIVSDDNTSCEKAIARMKREFCESPEYVVRVMEK